MNLYVDAIISKYVHKNVIQIDVFVITVYLYVYRRQRYFVFFVFFVLFVFLVFFFVSCLIIIMNG